jgi:hypothetical protein
MNHRIARVIAASAVLGLTPALAWAHPNGHDALPMADLGRHVAADPFHLLTLAGVAGAGLVALATAAVVRSVRARRLEARRR